MALLQLMARLGLDTSGFTSGLRQAEAQARTSSGGISSSFKKAFATGIGLGAVQQGVSAFRALSAGMKQAAKDAEELGIQLDRGVIQQLTEIENKTKGLGVELKVSTLPLVQAAATVFDGLVKTYRMFSAVMTGGITGAMQGYKSGVAGGFKTAGPIGALMYGISGFIGGIGPGMMGGAYKEATKLQSEADALEIANANANNVDATPYAKGRRAQQRREAMEALAKLAGPIDRASIENMDPGQRAQMLWGRYDSMVGMAQSMHGLRRMSGSGAAAYGRDFADLIESMNKYKLLNTKQREAEVLNVLKEIERNTKGGSFQ